MKCSRLSEHVLQITLAGDDLIKYGISIVEIVRGEVEMETIFEAIFRDLDEENQQFDIKQVAIQFEEKNQMQIFLSNTDDENGLQSFVVSRNLEAQKKFFSADDDTFELESALDFSADDEADDNLFAELSHIAAANEHEVRRSVEKGIYSPVFVFNDFNDLILLAQNFVFDEAVSDLFKYNDHYYLTLDFEYENAISAKVAKTMSYVLDYADVARNVTKPMLVEQGEHIMKDVAIELLRYYFKA
ncbi:adaptor protein MecA [Periweissella ghanensis]|uniref:Adapter protein MecA n=1 Tax=Periweissella ghanensis TaxID=467997 RepID=A0ABM8ZC03_9LACO|nr:adaptor protein MecA [Periweissella ghanensis]MCM0600682.1 adaptor protein MecA [Periweissella ghanensis]CAH0418428.1 Adapter protein MecA [Periweissella ghanensis]